MKLSVVIPVYNEVNTIREILSSVLEIDPVKEVILVDDCSTDGTREILREWEAKKTWRDRVRIFFQPENMGKGAALRRGFKEVQGDIILVQDADLEYNPKEYTKLIEPILDGRADVVYGSRFLGTPRRVLMFWHTVGNKFLTLLCNLCTDLNLTDMETGYKVFRREILERLHLRCNRFGFEPEVTAKIARMNCRIYEVPISYNGRDYWEGKKIGWTDGLKAVVAILWYSFFDSETDDLEYRTLQRVRKLQRYHQWMFSKFRLFLGKRVLETGSGIGNMTRHLLDREFVLATEVKPNYLSILRNTLGKYQKIRVEPFDVLRCDLERFRSCNIDSILCVNVLEHLEDDLRPLRNMYQLLEPKGRLFLSVPAHPWLYGTMDRYLGHFRRYKKGDLKKKLEAQGFRVIFLKHFNRIGILGWLLNGKILRRRGLPFVQLRIFDFLVPLFKLEDLCSLPFGLSLMAVVERPE